MQVQHMMERYDYASRKACLRNRIAISYHQNSKYESLPSGCLSGLCFFLKQSEANSSLFVLRSSLNKGVYLGLCLSNIYPFTLLLFNDFVQFALFVFFKLSSGRAELGSHPCPPRNQCETNLQQWFIPVYCLTIFLWC